MIIKINNPKKRSNETMMINGRNLSTSLANVNIIFLAPYSTLCELVCKQTYFSLAHGGSSLSGQDYP